MGDDVLSIKHWLYALTGIETASLSIPKDFKRPTWFIEEPHRIPEPARSDVFRERVTMHVTFMAKDINQLKNIGNAVRQDLADRKWVIPLYGSDQVQVGFMRECRLTYSKADGLDQLIELKYLVYIPYTPIVFDPLTEIHSRYVPTLTKGGEINGS